MVFVSNDVCMHACISTFMKENPEEIDPRKILNKAKAEMKEAVRAKMRLFDCSGKAM